MAKFQSCLTGGLIQLLSPWFDLYFYQNGNQLFIYVLCFCQNINGETKKLFLVSGRSFIRRKVALPSRLQCDPSTVVL